MRKALIIIFVSFIAFPAVALAGTVGTRYDVTIGGYVKFDLGYSTQDMHSDPNNAARASSASRKNLYDEDPNTFFSAGESRFNFLVKGPDALGAKTSAFLEGDFRGVTTGNQYGGFQLRHSYVKLDWSNADLIVGQAWQQFGMIYDKGAIGFSDFYSQMMGTRLPQIAMRYYFTKNFNYMVGILSPTEWSGAGGIRGSNDSYARYGLPYVEYEFEFKTERCGKIGPQMMRFALGGLVGREKKTNTLATATNTTITYDTARVWITAFRYYVPIIAERKQSKANALGLNGNFFIGQNFAGINWLGVGGTSVGSYWRPNDPVLGYATEAASPTAFGAFAQLSYYFQNNAWVNAMYGYLKYNYSSFARSAAPQAGAFANETDFKGVNQINMNQTYGISVLYEPSASLRFGAQWLRTFTAYNGYGTPAAGPTVFTTGTGNLAPNGTLDQYRVAAYYFF